MYISVYLRVLSERLEEQGVDKATIEKILRRERSLLSGLSPKQLEDLMNDERLEVILASAVKQNAASEASKKATLQAHEDKTVAVQDRLEATILPTPDEETTVTSTEEKTCVITLATDTATIVISRDNGGSYRDDHTLAVPPGIEKLLHETGTVRISEKDTLFYETEEEQRNDEASTVPLSVITDADGLTEESTVAVSHHVPKTDEESPDPSATSPLPRLSFDHLNDVKSADKNEPPVKNTHSVSSPTLPPLVLPESSVLSAEDLRNNHPKLALVWLSFVFAPTIMVVLALIGLGALIGNLVLLLALSLCMLVYLAAFLAPVLLTVYSAVFGFGYLINGEGLKAMAEFGVSLSFIGLFILFASSLFKPLRRLIDKTLELIVTFNKKIVLLIRNLYRYTLKGAERV